MKPLVRFMQPYAKAVIAFGLTLILFWFSRLPVLSAVERMELASRFAFTEMALPEIPGRAPQSIREVHPSLRRNASWVSSVGAAIALNDLDGDGLPNDSCHVDPRTDQVIVAPVPGTSARYQPFPLELTELPYDKATMAPMGCLPNDLNEDGDLDLLVYFWGRTPVAYLHKGLIFGNGTVSADQDTALNSLKATDYAQVELISGGERWYTNAATCADLDGDGHADLVIGNYFQDKAEILNSRAVGRESMQHSMTRAYNGGHNRLLLWSGATGGPHPSVTFKAADDVLDETVARAWTLAIGAIRVVVK